MRITEPRARQVALLCSITGLAVILIASVLLSPLEVSIEEIDESMLSQRVATAGKVSWVSAGEKALLFGIKDGTVMTAVIFSPSAEQISAVTQGNLIRIVGKVEKYKGKLEIVAETVQVIAND